MSAREPSPEELNAGAAALAALATAAARHQLFVSGTVAVRPEDGLAEGIASLALLSPAEPGFWPHLTATQEFADGKPDPIDRWSRRVVGQLACDLGGKAYFPFGGPPYRPFIGWALRSGRVWASPVSLLISAEMGLFTSFRGAVGLRLPLPAPEPRTSPCTGCAAPCRSACPVSALGPEGYNVAACHDHLNTPEGNACLSAGCHARRACPFSETYGRLPEQSAWHMRHFHT
ncbi:ferredoxin [Phaeovulum sp. W22_SRMD_FR3]|uniref:ferredoxin n=1 Tax=Phaeovulum sp. W22_SRMD_FR3 TaxID=3240274 RepID=UPI003F995A97